MVATPRRWDTQKVTVLGTDFLAVLPLLFAVVLVTLLCRWVFSRRGVKRLVARPDYGLLSPVARLNSAGEAEAVRQRLGAEGIRGTVAPAGKGFDARGIPWPAEAHVVLVFPADVARATALLGASH